MENEKLFSTVDLPNIPSKKLRKGYKCPLCRQYVKLYRRPINSTMVRCLANLYRVTLENGEKFYHATQFIKGYTSGGDFPKLRYWGFIEEMPKDKKDKTKKRSGYWKITQGGIAFLHNVITAPKYGFFHNQKFLGHDADGGRVGVHDALGTKFNYEEIMSFAEGRPSPQLGMNL